MRLVLLTGVPATGKTTLGEHLASEHGFAHLDFEDMLTLDRFWRFGERGFRVLWRGGSLGSPILLSFRTVRQYGQ